MARQNLSRRELEVAELLTKEKTSSEIAKELNVSKKTVQFHLENISEKTGQYEHEALIGWLSLWFK